VLNTPFHASQTILGFKEIDLDRTLLFENSVGFLKIYFYYAENTKELSVILMKNDEKYEPQQYNLKSKYFEGLIQDLLAEINSFSFLEMFNLQIYSTLRDILRIFVHVE
jgi:hypothetical protein